VGGCVQKPLSLEAVSERWWVGSVHTVRRWLRPLAAPELVREVRRLAEEAAPANAVPSTFPSPAHEILSLIPRVFEKLIVHAEDISRVPYHFILHIQNRLKLIAG